MTAEERLKEWLRSQFEQEAADDIFSRAASCFVPRWSRERPTKPGWYWWRNGGVVRPMEVLVGFPESGLLRVATYPYPVPLDHPSLADVEWSGRLAPPGGGE